MVTENLFRESYDVKLLIRVDHVGWHGIYISESGLAMKKRQNNPLFDVERIIIYIIFCPMIL